MSINEILLFINPEFDKRFAYGVSKLYNIFCVKNNFNLRIINVDFLKNNLENVSTTKTIVIVGGDGTVHKVINAIPDKQLSNYSFGIIPAGTANEFSKLFNIPNNIELAANIIINSKKITAQKIGIINDKIKFLTGILYGVEAEVLMSTPKIFKHAYGLNAFYIGNIFYFLKFLVFNFDLIKNFKMGSKTFRTNNLLINNAHLNSKGMRLSASIENDANSFYILYPHSKLKFFEVLRLSFMKYFKLLFLNDKSIQLLLLPEILLEFLNEIDVLVDGEPYKFNTPIYIKKFPELIKVISG